MIPTLRETFGKPVLFHWISWYGKNGIENSIPGYDSRDPDVISHQLKCMQIVGGEGAGVIALTYGNTSDFMKKACVEMGLQANALGMPFSLCFDPWTVKNSDGSMPDQATKNNRMIEALNDKSTKFMFDMSCYIAGHPVFDFSTGCDKSAIEAAVPGIKFWLLGVDYDWIKIPTKPNQTKLPCAYMSFDDGTGDDRNKQCWDPSQPVRLVNARGGKTFFDCDVSGAQDFVQLVTWNDYNEQTAFEQWASMVAGVRI